MNNLIRKEIDRLVNKYAHNDSKDLFRAELEYLIALAEREELRKASTYITKNFGDVIKEMSKE